MDQSLEALLAPSAALVISLATFVATQVRTNQIDSRAAAKDTVEILATQNKSLLDEITEIRTRMITLDQQLLHCERARTLLLERLTGLLSSHAEDTNKQ